MFRGGGRFPVVLIRYAHFTDRLQAIEPPARQAYGGEPAASCERMCRRALSTSPLPCPAFSLIMKNSTRRTSSQPPAGADALRDLFDTLPDVQAWMKDARRRYLWVNRT